MWTRSWRRWRQGKVGRNDGLVRVILKFFVFWFLSFFSKKNASVNALKRERESLYPGFLSFVCLFFPSFFLDLD